jgi:FixJ family two-component response regulator
MESGDMLKTDVLSDEIFIVDDDPALGDLLSLVLEPAGYRVTCFNHAEAFVSVARLRTPACILLDVYMPHRSGLEVLRDLDAHNYPAPIIIMSGRVSISLAIEAMKIGAFDVVEKPFDPDGFSARVFPMTSNRGSSRSLSRPMFGCAAERRHRPRVEHRQRNYDPARRQSGVR